MKLFSRFTDKKPLDPDVTVYRVEDMHCSHCEAEGIGYTFKGRYSNEHI